MLDESESVSARVQIARKGMRRMDAIFSLPGIAHRPSQLSPGASITEHLKALASFKFEPRAFFGLRLCSMTSAEVVFGFDLSHRPLAPLPAVVTKVEISNRGYYMHDLKLCRQLPAALAAVLASMRQAVWSGLNKALDMPPQTLWACLQATFDSSLHGDSPAVRELLRRGLSPVDAFALDAVLGSHSSRAPVKLTARSQDEICARLTSSSGSANDCMSEADQCADKMCGPCRRHGGCNADYFAE